MFDYIKGELADKGLDYVVLDHKGLGFRLEFPISASDQFQVGTEVKLFTHFTITRGETPVLYGFATREQRKIFHNILAVSGIGPRLAMHILGGFTLEQLESTIAANDVDRLSRLPKLGPKKAQLLILELQGKFVSATSGGAISVITEAEEALVALGYKRQEAMKTIAAIKQPDLTTEELVKIALQNITTGTKSS